MKRSVILTTIFVLLLAGGIFWYFSASDNAPTQTQCTLDAKICPDGTTVGREGPNCEFAKCPGEIKKEGWEQVTDQDQGITYKYPEQLDLEFIFTQEWPPEVEVTEGIFSCAEEVVTVGDKIYCLRVETEGAAGSVYKSYMYLYSMENQGRSVNVRFTLRYPQCANYSEHEQTECEREQAEFDVNELADSIVESIEFI